MKISDFGLDLIEAFEGFFPKPYKDPIGIVTQGYGHTSMSGGETIGGTWTKAKAKEVLRDDLARKYEPAVRKAIKPRKQPVTQGQYDALVSFTFNCGEGNLRKSSILKNFLKGDDAAAQRSFALFNKAGGKVFPGLVRRRASEALAFSGVQDLNFDGKRSKNEPVYGVMPQQIDPESDAKTKAKAKVEDEVEAEASTRFAADAELRAKIDAQVAATFVLDKATVRKAQDRLRELGYVMVGEPDGLWGARSAAAVTAFCRVNPKVPYADPLTRELHDAIMAPDAVAMPIAPERFNAPPEVVKEIAPEAAPVRDASFWAKVQGGLSAAGAAVWGVLSNFGDASGLTTPLGLAGAAAIVATLVVAYIIWKRSQAADTAITAAVQTGARVRSAGQ